MSPDQVVHIDYTNWRGERAVRQVSPMNIVFGSSAFHAEPQWLLGALDVERGQIRFFALKDIHRWGVQPITATQEPSHDD